MSKFWRIFALRTQKFFWWNKSNFVEVKKFFFDGKPKMTKKNATEFLKIRKNVKNRVFLAFLKNTGSWYLSEGLWSILLLHSTLNTPE